MPIGGGRSELYYVRLSLIENADGDRNTPGMYSLSLCRWHPIPYRPYTPYSLWALIKSSALHRE
jgi:hypothetical protein